jgi:hypothetical protein
VEGTVLSRLANRQRPIVAAIAMGAIILLGGLLLPVVARGGVDGQTLERAKSATRSRDVEKAQRTKLRWRPARPAPTEETSASSRAQRHLQRESAHVVRASATKPKDDPFADPFFDDEPAKQKLKVEPIVSQPVQPPADAQDPFRLQPQPDMNESAEQPEPLAGQQELKELAQAPSGELPPCPSPEDVKKIREITTDISAQAGEFPPECGLGNVQYQPRIFAPVTYCWKASALCSKPLYFQQAALERYGHSWGPVLQPFISGAEFYLTVPILPYLMGMDPPCECQYALGYYRPGSCAPKMICPIPISLRGGLLEAGVVLGAVALVP